MKALQKRDREQEEQVKKSKRSSESLVDMHRKKLKENKNVSFLLKFHFIISRLG